MTQTDKLSIADDPDQQPPLPFAAAVAYAREVSAASRAADATAGLSSWLNIPYGEHRLQQYDVFAPQRASGLPLLVFWHGGGWTNGYRHWIHGMAQSVCEAGFVLIAPSYRLAPQYKMPLIYSDACAALSHAQAQAAHYGADAQQVVLSGHSAGGHLAALVALRASAAVQQTIKACMPMSGIMDLHHPNPAEGSLEERVYSWVLDIAAQDALYSPVAWTAGRRVAFDLTVGELDSARVKSSNARLHAVLAHQGCEVALHTLSGHSHFDTHTRLLRPTEPEHAAWYGRLKAFTV